MSRMRNVTFAVRANVRNFNQGMKSVEDRMHRVGRQATFLGRDLTRSITMPVVAVGTGLAALAVQTGQFADELLDLSEITGLTTDELQEWRQVARVAGVDTDALSNAAGGLTRRMRQLQNGSGAAHDAFQRLGISQQFIQENLDNTDALMGEAINRLGEMESGLDRASIANDIFGRRWEQLGPIMGMSADEIQRAREEAHELGFVLDGEALNAANDFRIEMDMLQERVAASGRSMAMDFMPIIQDMIPLAERLVGVIADKVRWFSELDRGTQENIIKYAALAAAIGPVISLSGRLITSIVGISRAVRGLTMAMAANPFVAMGIGLTAITAHAVRAERSIRNLNRAVEESLNADMGTQSLEDVNSLIAETENKLEALRGVPDFFGIESRRIARMEKELQNLIRRRDELAGHLFTPLDSGNTQEEIEVVEAVADAIERVRVAASEPIHNIFDPGEEARIRALHQEFTAFSSSLDDFSVDIHVDDVAQRMFPPGSIGFAEEALGNLRTQLRAATDPAEVERIQVQMAAYQQQIYGVNEATQEGSMNLTEFGNIGVQIFDRMVFQGEKLQSTLKSITRQLATRGIMMLLTGGFSGASGFFGSSGILGRMFNVNDAMITSKGDVVNFHPDDNILAMKDFSKLGVGGGSNARDMEKAMKRALGSVNWSIKNGDIVMAQAAGKRGYR